MTSWVSAYVEPTGPAVRVHERPWAAVIRVPTAQGVAWFKACAPVQGFEPRLSAHLSARWPDRVAPVLAHDEDRAWLLLSDAGTAVGELGNPPELWLRALRAEEKTHLAGFLPRLDRLRDSYLEPWGPGLRDAFALAMRVGAFAHVLAHLRQRDHLPEDARASFDRRLSGVLRRALATTVDR